MNAHIAPVCPSDTKEKPFICQCQAAFARRDLLTRHQRIALHEDADASGSPDGLLEPEQKLDSGEQQHGPIEADMAAAVSLSAMSVHPWPQQPPLSPAKSAVEPYPIAVPRNGILVNDDVEAPYQQSLLAEPFYEHGTQDAMGFDAHFREFANFLDGVGLPAEWSPYFDRLDRNNEAIDPAMRDSRGGTVTPGPGQPRTQPGTPFSSWLPSAPTSNRIAETFPHQSRPLPLTTRFS